MRNKLFQRVVLKSLPWVIICFGIVLRHLDNIGKRIDSFKASGAAVYLYDLSEEALREQKD